jgi:hypothetical protein
MAEMVIRLTGAGLFFTAAGHGISGRRFVYYGADRFIPVRPVDVSRWSAVYCLSIRTR